MATGRSSFAKRQRDMAKKARAEAKRQKRFDRNAHREFDEVGSVVDPNDKLSVSSSALSNAEIMLQVEELHRLYDDGRLDLETFDEKKASLMSQISIH